jgi:membrane protein
MLREAWALARDTFEGFVADGAVTRGAAIACFSLFSIAPQRCR